MRQITRMSTDTCGCVIDYAWDDEVTPRVYEPVAVTLCGPHRATATDAPPVPHRYRRVSREQIEAVDDRGRRVPLATDREHPGARLVWEVVRAEVARRDAALAAVEAAIGTRREIAWHFDATRQLVLDLPADLAGSAAAVDAAVRRAVPSGLVLRPAKSVA